MEKTCPSSTSRDTWTASCRLSRLKKARLYSAVGLCCWLAPSFAFGLTGNEWKENGVPFRNAYVGGVLAGWHDISFFYNEQGKETMSSKVLCIADQDGVTFDLGRAIVEKYMNEHPEDWHKPMTTIIFSAMREICRQKSHGRERIPRAAVISSVGCSRMLPLGNAVLRTGALHRNNHRQDSTGYVGMVGIKGNQ
jgi:hypothetical protein